MNGWCVDHALCHCLLSSPLISHCRIRRMSFLIQEKELFSDLRAGAHGEEDNCIMHEINGLAYDDCGKVETWHNMQICHHVDWCLRPFVFIAVSSYAAVFFQPGCHQVIMLSSWPALGPPVLWTTSWPFLSSSESEFGWICLISDLSSHIFDLPMLHSVFIPILISILSCLSCKTDV